MKKIRYSIIDDDDFAHDDLIRLMQIHTDFECIAHYFNVIEAAKEINATKPDFIFLDVEMPNLNGFELLNFLDKSICVVITSSFKNYACESFEHQVFDFLYKPIQHDKLFKTIYRLTEKFKKKGESDIITTNINVKTHLYVSRLKGKGTFKLDVKDISTIVKLGNELEIKTVSNERCYCKDNINSIIKVLPSDVFKIINRGTIVNIYKVILIDDFKVQTSDGDIYEVSEKYRNSENKSSFLLKSMF